MSENTAVEQAKQEIKTLADKDVDSVDSDVRYMAYGARLRTALRAGQRYIAYVRAGLVTLNHASLHLLYIRLVMSAKLSGL